MVTKIGEIVCSSIYVLSFLCLFWQIHGRPQTLKPGCWYEGKRYQEGEMVNTSEPCLRCRCNESSLRCRLRICPKLPNPPPNGCTTRTPRENACCPELVCDHSHERNVTGKRDPAKDMRRQDDSCLHEGVRYGPGSAMMGSRRCEYCYCISGSRRCLRPRCLLPLAGCVPIYAPYSCCPVAYNCNKTSEQTLSNHGASSVSRNGCRVGNRRYEEGEMVRDIGWKGTCDNCFCAMGGVRCVPLSCAPPLQGCTPIVREGHCCPSTYNCSGTIEVKATQNFASYAFISKDYAKFRKENNFFTHSNYPEIYEALGNSTVEGRGHKNPEQEQEAVRSTRKPERPTSADTKKSLMKAKISEEVDARNATSTTEKSDLSHENETMNNEIPIETKIGKFSEETTLSDFTETTDDRTDASTNSDVLGIDQTETTILTDEFDATSSKFSIKDEETSTQLPFSSTLTSDDTMTTTFDIISTIEAYETTLTNENPESKTPEKKTTRIFESTTRVVQINDSRIVNVQKKENANLKKMGSIESSVIPVQGVVTVEPSTILMPDDIFVINVTLRTNVSVGDVQGVTMNPMRSIPPDIEAILNITNRKKGEDYEYDYSQPTLPPSLPNVRIIPFVAADALVKQSEEVSSQVTSYPLGTVSLPPPEFRPSVTSGPPDNFYDIATQQNRFSPPVETEGGFVPREPSFFDPPYRSTDHNSDIRNSDVTSVPTDITNSHRKYDGICVFENRNYRHGDLLPSSGHCIICICYYGEVTCSDEKCPPLKIGCRRVEHEKICCGQIICVEAEESPTVVLDRADAIAAAPREPLPSLDGIASPDPFRDVIKTKPAPDLPSLIEDMIPYLVEHRITKTPVTSAPTPSTPIKLPSASIHFPSSTSGYFDLQFSPERKKIQDPYAKENAEKTSSDRKKLQELYVKETSENETKVWSTDPMKNGEAGNEDGGDDDIFSFGSVLELLFSESEKSPSSEDTKKTSEAPSDFSQSGDRFPQLFPVTPLSKVTAKVTSKINVTADLSTENYALITAKVPEKSSNFTENLETSTIISTTRTTATSTAITWIKLVDQTKVETTKIPGVQTEMKDDSTTKLMTDNDIVTSVSGLLKLAGCNIYGKMYPVGRIITELSNPCLECRCTEVGVQCQKLHC